MQSLFGRMCDTCFLKKQKEKKQAAYLNLLQFFVRGRRFLCVSCADKLSNRRELIPLDPEHQNTEFIRNITVNSHLKDSAALMELFKNRISGSVFDKLTKINDTITAHLSKWMEVLEYQFNAVITTFQPDTLSEFLKQVEEYQKNEQENKKGNPRKRRRNGEEGLTPEAEMTEKVKTLMEAGKKDLGALDYLQEAVNTAGHRIGGQLDQELKRIQTSWSKLDKYIRRVNLVKIYEGTININSPPEKVNITDLVAREEARKQPILIDDTVYLDESEGEECVFYGTETYPFKVNRMNRLTAWTDIETKATQTTKISIQSDDNPDLNLTIERLSRCTNLNKLIISEPILCKKEALTKILSVCSSLNSLQLNCQNQFKGEHIELMLKKHKFHSFNSLYFTYNYYGRVAQIDERHSFMEGISDVERRSPLQDSKARRNLAFNFKQLDNGFLSEIDDPLTISAVLAKPQLRHLALGSYQNQETKNLPLPLLGAILSSKLQLRSFVLLRVMINENAMKGIFSQCTNSLSTVVVWQCEGMSDDSVQIFNKCSFLKQLQVSRMNNRSFRGRGMFSIGTLATLIIQECAHIQILQTQNMSQLKTLSHLNLMNNPWVNDTVLKNIQKLPNLTHLNLAKTSLSKTAKHSILAMKKLKQLNLSNTKVDNFINEIHQLGDIRKLSIRGLRLESMEYLYRNTKRLAITHLDIAECKGFKQDILDLFPKLQYLTMSLDHQVSIEKLNQLARKGGSIIRL